MFMSPVQVRQFPLPPARRPMCAPLAAEPYPGVQALWGKATQRRSADPVFGVEALVVHVADHSGTDAAMARMQAAQASWHWIIPARNEAQHGHFLWAAAPECRAARHLPPRTSHPALNGGKPGLTQVTLAVLLAADPGQPGAAPSDWQMAALALLIRHVWARYPALARVLCRSEIDAATPPGALDWDRLCQMATLLPGSDLPPLVARATPLVMLDDAGRAEPALRTR